MGARYADRHVCNGFARHLRAPLSQWSVLGAVQHCGAPRCVLRLIDMGGVPEDWFAVNHSGDISGDNSRFVNLLRLARGGGLADPGKYATHPRIHRSGPVQRLRHHQLVHGQQDWPEYNWYAGGNYPAGRNLFFVWDGEAGWEEGAEIILGPDELPGAPYPNIVKLLSMALMENPDFRTLFADRLYRHLFNDGILTDQASQAVGSLSMPRSNPLSSLSRPLGRCPP